MPDAADNRGTVMGGVRWLLRLEGLAIFIVGTALFFAPGGQWWFYAMLFFAPDLSLAGYLAGPRVGAAVYDTVHSLTGPLMLALGAFFMVDAAPVLSVAFVWLAHIGFDRALGLGLKYGTGFRDTHLGRIGGLRL